jgi:hypothetical protein
VSRSDTKMALLVATGSSRIQGHIRRSFFGDDATSGPFTAGSDSLLTWPCERRESSLRLGVPISPLSIVPCTFKARGSVFEGIAPQYSGCIVYSRWQNNESRSPVRQHNSAASGDVMFDQEGKDNGENQNSAKLDRPPMYTYVMGNDRTERLVQLAAQRGYSRQTFLDGLSQGARLDPALEFTWLREWPS